MAIGEKEVKRNVGSLKNLIWFAYAATLLNSTYYLVALLLAVS